MSNGICHYGTLRSTEHLAILAPKCGGQRIHVLRGCRQRNIAIRKTGTKILTTLYVCIRIC